MSDEQKAAIIQWAKDATRALEALEGALSWIRDTQQVRALFHIARALPCDYADLIHAVRRGHIGALDNLGIVVTSEDVAGCWEGEQWRPDRLLDLIAARYT